MFFPRPRPCIHEGNLTTARQGSEDPPNSRPAGGAGLWLFHGKKRPANSARAVFALRRAMREADNVVMEAYNATM